MAHATAGSADDAARTAMGHGIAIPYLDIPEAQAVTPEGSASGQQISPLLMSIKKLVSHQDAIESEGSLAHTPAANGSIAGIAFLCFDCPLQHWSSWYLPLTASNCLDRCVAHECFDVFRIRGS